jgi:hypothetical protein
MKSQVPDWMDQQIWPQIWQMLVNDAHFRTFEQARAITGKFNGQISQLIHDGYLTFQMVAIRRLCDAGKDVISLRRAFTETKKERPDSSHSIDQFLRDLDARSNHVRIQVNHHIAHTLNPAQKPNFAAWSMHMKNLTEAHEAICRAATSLDRDILRRKTFTDIVPVAQFNIWEDYSLWVPENALKEVQKFWHAHVKKVNAWGK